MGPWDEVIHEQSTSSRVDSGQERRKKERRKSAGAYFNVSQEAHHKREGERERTEKVIDSVDSNR